ncbi:MAG: nucleotidyltransferase family protein [Myxococcales bacterium]
MAVLRSAMVFAAGLGTRMGELTRSTPKPLVQVGGRALLDYALTHFEQAGCERIVVNCHYLGEQIAAHVAARRGPSAIALSREEVLLETGGGVMQALPLLGEGPFFSANSDTIWLDHAGDSSALGRLSEAFDPARFDALLLLHPRERAIGYRGPGDFDLNEQGELVRSPSPRYVFSGLQILTPALFAGRTVAPFSLRELYRAAERPDGSLARMGGLVHRGDWIHVGTPGELREAERFFAGRPAGSAAPATPA